MGEMSTGHERAEEIEVQKDPDLIPTEMQWVYQRYQPFLKEVYQKVLFPDKKGKKGNGVMAMRLTLGGSCP